MNVLFIMFQSLYASVLCISNSIFVKDVFMRLSQPQHYTECFIPQVTD